MYTLSSKPYICIIGSDSIQELTIQRYIRYTSIGRVVCAGRNAVDYIAEQWAKSNKVEFVVYPNIRGFEYCYQDMIAASDVVFFFWNGIDDIAAQVQTCQMLGRKYFVHLIQN